MARTRVVQHNKGYRALRTSQWAVDQVMSAATRLARTAGEGYVAKLSGKPKRRAHASVFPNEKGAIRDNARNNTLIRAIGGARR
jgi:hypothetical protein